jgi:hypothetical protein
MYQGHTGETVTAMIAHAAPIYETGSPYNNAAVAAGAGRELRFLGGGVRITATGQPLQLSGNLVGCAFYDAPMSGTEFPTDNAALSRNTRYKLKRIPGGLEVIFDFNSSYDDYTPTAYLFGSGAEYYIYVALDADATGTTTCQIESWGHWESLGVLVRSQTSRNPNHTDLYFRLKEAVSSVVQSLAHTVPKPDVLVKQVLEAAGLPAIQTLLSVGAQRFLSEQMRQITL